MLAIHLERFGQRKTTLTGQAQPLRTEVLVDQFALSNRFWCCEPDNSLLPRSYSRVQTPYLKQNRKESFAVAYGDSNKSYTFPESLRILLNAYIRVELPVNGENGPHSLQR